MMKDDADKKSAVADISHMYVGPNQRASLLEKAFEMFRKKGYSFNQAKALSAQSVEAFLNDQRRQQVEAIKQAERDGNAASADQMAQYFIDQELPK